MKNILPKAIRTDSGQEEALNRGLTRAIAKHVPV